MVERWASALRRPADARRFIGVLAVFFAAAAAVFDPGLWWEAAVLVPPVALFLVWSLRPGTRALRMLGAVAPVCVVVACWGGELEISMFLVSLVALAAAAWEERRTVAALIVLLCLATPIVASVASPTAEILWPVWFLGIAFPAVLGLIIRRLERVTLELVRAREELAEHAVLHERQRIGRDVHDLVGHGLAAVMLHVTGARHVLGRDPGAADEALRTAEEVGRASMQELRRTVDLLRGDEPAPDQPPASLREVAELARTYARAGLQVEYSEHGDVGAASAVQALTAYRIAQQALANAAQHAREARTVVRLTVTADDLTLAVDSVGARGPAPADPRGYGLTSMRERARVAGGRLSAGPTADGWSVRCVLPADPSAPGAAEMGRDAPAAAEAGRDAPAAARERRRP